MSQRVRDPADATTSYGMATTRRVRSTDRKRRTVTEGGQEQTAAWNSLNSQSTVKTSTCTALGYVAILNRHSTSSRPAMILSPRTGLERSRKALSSHPPMQSYPFVDLLFMKP